MTNSSGDRTSEASTPTLAGGAQTCLHTGCDAAVLEGVSTACLLHAQDARFEAEVDKARAAGVLDLRGALLTEDTLNRLRARWPGRDDPDPWRVRLDRCTGSGPLSFEGLGFGPESSLTDMVFDGTVNLGGCSFGAETTIRNSTFQAAVNLRSATFSGRCWFALVKFEGGIDAKRASFGRLMNFLSVNFGDTPYFRLARFGDASFRHCTFGANAYFGGYVWFESHAKFHECTFGENARFVKLVVGDELSFTRCAFAGVTMDVLSRGDLTVASCRFLGRVEMQMIAYQAAISRCDFDRSTQLRPAQARLSLLYSRFAQPVLIARRTPSHVTKILISDDCWPPSSEDADLEAETESINLMPVIQSLRGSDLSAVTLGDVDLGDCAFAQSHNLDQLRIEDTRTFRYSTGRFSARRRIIREERDHRATPPPTTEERRAAARSVALIYQSLRQGREERGDEPGAADFYYGEMQMRRHGAGPGFERVLLTAYWAVSGYGLRAWRALAALVVVIGVATACFAVFGFDHTSTPVFVPDARSPSTIVASSAPGPKPGVVDAVTYSLTSATALLRPTPTVPLRWSGQLIEVILRVLGPVLIGLAALAIRARLKR